MPPGPLAALFAICGAASAGLFGLFGRLSLFMNQTLGRGPRFPQPQAYVRPACFAPASRALPGGRPRRQCCPSSTRPLTSRLLLALHVLPETLLAALARRFLCVRKSRVPIICPPTLLRSAT